MNCNRGEETLACIHFTNFSQNGTASCFQKLCFLLSKSTEGLVLSILFASCPSCWVTEARPGKGSTAWSIVRPALPFDTSYFTFATWKTHNNLSASSELPHSTLKDSCWESFRLVHGICPDDEYQEYFFQAWQSWGESLPQAASVLTSASWVCTCVSLCVESTGGPPFHFRRYRSHSWTGVLCLHAPDMSVMKTNSSRAKADVVEGRCQKPGIVAEMMWRMDCVLSVMLTV